MDDNADPFIDQGGEQAYNDALQYVEGAYGQDYKSPHIADGRVNGRSHGDDIFDPAEHQVGVQRQR